MHLLHPGSAIYISASRSCVAQWTGLKDKSTEVQRGRALAQGYIAR